MHNLTSFFLLLHSKVSSRIYRLQKGSYPKYSEKMPMLWHIILFINIKFILSQILQFSHFYVNQICSANVQKL